MKSKTPSSNDSELKDKTMLSTSSKTIRQTGDFGHKTFNLFMNLVALGERTSANFHPQIN